MCRDTTMIVCLVKKVNNPAVRENATMRLAHINMSEVASVFESMLRLRSSTARPRNQGCTTVNTLLPMTVRTPRRRIFL